MVHYDTIIHCGKGAISVACFCNFENKQSVQSGYVIKLFWFDFFLFAFFEQDFITLKLLDRKTQGTWNKL